MNTTKPLYPLRFEPILKRLIWGGRRLHTHLDKPLGEGSDYAESWEIADHRDDVSRVAEGPLKGESLRTLLRERPSEILGERGLTDKSFPLLIKFLDAHQVLSVQVHPDDDLGNRLAEDRGKTEAWVVVHAEPGSTIYAGLKAGVTREAFIKAVEEGTVEPLLHRITPKAGDCIFVPAGTVHAIGAGVIVAEVQQQSDATFRVYDWGRVGADGRPRRLHLAEALESIDFDGGPVNPVIPKAAKHPWGQHEQLVDCPQFVLERYQLSLPTRVGFADRFTVLVGFAGTARVLHEGQAYAIRTGETLLLPAAVGPCEIAPVGQATILACSTRRSS